MWVIFLLSAIGFAIGALILFSIGWLVIHKIEMHINRQDESFDIEKEVYKAGRFREKGIPNPVSQFKIYLIFYI